MQAEVFSNINFSHLVKDKVKCKFLNCSFFECDFRDCNLENFEFEGCTMIEADFFCSKFESCTFKKCDLQKSSFSSCSINNCIFENCNMSNSDFSNALSSGITKIYWTKFSNCKMTGANFLNSKSNKITFENCILRLANFYGFTFKKQTIIGLDLAEADICDCNFDESIFENSFMRNANFKGNISFHNTDLRGCDISGVKAEKIMGAFISKSQATDLLSKLNIKVI